MSGFDRIHRGQTFRRYDFPLDLPHDDMEDIPEVPRDRQVRPSLDEVLELRRDRMATVRGLVEAATGRWLAGETTPVTEPGYPEGRSFPVRDIFSIIVNEEWWHHVYATRDLALLEARLSASGDAGPHH